MRRSTLTTAVAAPAVLALAVFTAACGDDESTDEETGADTGATAEETMDDMATDESTDS